MTTIQLARCTFELGRGREALRSFIMFVSDAEIDANAATFNPTEKSTHPGANDVLSYRTEIRKHLPTSACLSKPPSIACLPGYKPLTIRLTAWIPTKGTGGDPHSQVLQ